MTPDFRVPFLRDRRECEHVRSLLTDYLDDELAAGMQRRVDRHVRFCPRCRRVLGNLRATINRLAHLETPTDDALDGELLERIQCCWRDPEGDATARAP